jgi:hypothetical protein
LGAASSSFSRFGALDSLLARGRDGGGGYSVPDLVGCVRDDSSSVHDDCVRWLSGVRLSFLAVRFLGVIHSPL